MHATCLTFAHASAVGRRILPQREEDRTTFLALRHAAMTGRDFTGIRWIRYRCLPIFAEPTNIPKVERRIAQ